MRKTETHKQCLTAFPKAISCFKDFLWRLATSSFLASLKDIIQNTAKGSMANQMLSLTKTNRKDDNFPDNLIQMWSLFIMLKYLLLLINSKIKWTEVQSCDQKMHMSCCVGPSLLSHSSHTLECPPSHLCSVVLWGMEICAPPLGVLQTPSGSCTQNKPGLSRQEHSVFLTAHRKLCWGLKGREQPGLKSTAGPKWHTTSGKLTSPKSCHKPQPTANGSRNSTAKEIRFPWKPGESREAGGFLFPPSCQWCSWYSSEGSDCQAQLWAVPHENKECLKPVSDHGLHFEPPDIHLKWQMEILLLSKSSLPDNKTGSGKHLAAFPYPDLMGTVATTQ